MKSEDTIHARTINETGNYTQKKLVYLSAQGCTYCMAVVWIRSVALVKEAAVFHSCFPSLKQKRATISMDTTICLKNYI